MDPARRKDRSLETVAGVGVCFGIDCPETEEPTNQFVSNSNPPKLCVCECLSIWDGCSAKNPPRSPVFFYISDILTRRFRLLLSLFAFQGVCGWLDSFFFFLVWLLRSPILLCPVERKPFRQLR